MLESLPCRIESSENGSTAAFLAFLRLENMIYKTTPRRSAAKPPPTPAITPTEPLFPEKCVKKYNFSHMNNCLESLLKTLKQKE